MNDINSESTDGQTIDTEDGPTPGALLKEARQRKDLSVDEIAKALYLTRNKVSALENDEYDKLQSQVFVKGYLRKYAPMVGLDADELVERYQNTAGLANEAEDGANDSDDDIPATLVPKFVVPAALFGVAAAALITIVVFVGNQGEGEANVAPASEIDVELAERVVANTADNEARLDPLVTEAERSDDDLEVVSELTTPVATPPATGVDPS